MTTVNKKIDTVFASVKITEAASRVLSRCEPQVTWGRHLLGGAHVYLYAAMLADFVLMAERDEWIGPAVQMSDSIQPTREFLVNHLFESLFTPITRQEFGYLYLKRVRDKVSKILACHREPT
jgi:hypothetical protein